MSILKNIELATVLPLASLVPYQPGQIISRTLVQNKAVSITLFAFEAGEEISTHASGGDALVMALDGAGVITIEDTEYQVKAGESIVMPAGKPHAVRAEERFQMLLTVVFPQ